MTIEAPERIPDPALERRWAALEARLVAVAELTRQGSIVRKAAKSGRGFWVLRYVDRSGDRPVHRSVYLGGRPELVRRAGRLLGEYREQRRRLEEVGAYARLTGGFVRAARRLARSG